MAKAEPVPPGETGYAAMICDRVAIEIGHQFDGLSGPDMGELHFLEIGIYEHTRDRHDHHQRASRRDALADLHLTARDDPIEGCADDGPFKIEACLVET